MIFWKKSIGHKICVLIFCTAFGLKQLASRLSNITTVTTGQKTIGSEKAVWPPDDGHKDARNMLRDYWLPIKSLIIVSSWSHLYLLKYLILPPLLCSTRTGCLHICGPWCISSRWSCPNFRCSWALLWSCLARRCLQSASSGFRRELPRLCTTTFRWTRYRLPPVFRAVLCDTLTIRRWSVDQPVPYFSHSWHINTITRLSASKLWRRDVGTDKNFCVRNVFSSRHEHWNTLWKPRSIFIFSCVYTWISKELVSVQKSSCISQRFTRSVSS